VTPSVAAPGDTNPNDATGTVNRTYKLAELALQFTQWTKRSNIITVI